MLTTTKCSLAGDRQIQSISFHYISFRSISILSSHLYLGLPGCICPSDFPHQNPVHTSFLFHACQMSYQPHPSWCDHPSNMWDRVQIMEHLIFCFHFPLSHAEYVLWTHLGFLDSEWQSQWVLEPVLQLSAPSHESHSKLQSTWALYLVNRKTAVWEHNTPSLPAIPQTLKLSCSLWMVRWNG